MDVRGVGMRDVQYVRLLTVPTLASQKIVATMRNT